MAKNDNLKDFLTDVADAIRAKKGTTDAINPQDFSSEIASIETGGGGGRDTMTYWKVVTLSVEVMEVAQTVSTLVKTEDTIGSFYYVAVNVGDSPLIAFAVDTTMKLRVDNIDMTVGEILASVGGLENLEGVIQITEEDFYSKVI